MNNKNEELLSKDVQNFLNSIRIEAEARKKQDELLNQEFMMDDEDVKDFSFDEDTNQELSEAAPVVEDTSNILEDDSDFSEDDLEQLF